MIGGLTASNATRPVIVSALLIAALADNLTDSLSIHIFQESGQLDQKDAFTGTLTNFFTRFLLCISFVFLIGLFPFQHVAEVAIIWGVLLLTVLTWLVARERKVKPLPEILKHLLIAFAVIAASLLIGYWMGARIN